MEKGGSIESIIGDYFLNKKEFSLDKWPVYIFLAFAIICFTNSAIFHLFSAYGENVNAFLSRLDYAGIAVLISGSCIPPYYYIYYCTFCKIKLIKTIGPYLLDLSVPVAF